MYVALVMAIENYIYALNETRLSLAPLIISQAILQTACTHDVAPGRRTVIERVPGTSFIPGAARRAVYIVKKM